MKDIIDVKPRAFRKTKADYSDLLKEEEEIKEVDKSVLFAHKPVYVTADTIVLPRNFESQIRQANSDVKRRYNYLKNEIMSYKGIKARMLKNSENFRRSGLVAKMRIKGKSLYIYLKLDPKTLPDGIVKAYDRGNYKGYKDVPTEIKVSTDLSMRRVAMLLELEMKALGISKVLSYEHRNYIEMYPYIENAVIEGKVMINL